MRFPPAPAQPPSRSRDSRAGRRQDADAAAGDEIHYDYTNERVSAVGNVQIYYDGTTLEADKVIYDQTTKRLHAEGNVRLTEADGKITYAEIMNLSDDFRDGFVDSLRLDTPDQTRMAAARADRSSGNFTVFQSGVYTACEACKDDPKKPPLWQVKAARIIHDDGEKMIYFEDARLEFFGKPVAYFPYFSAPDPTVKRKTGFLMPSSSSAARQYGFGVEIPYYWALAPDYDFTFSPRLMTKQGALLQRRMAPAADQRRLLDPRQRHLSARQGRIPARRRHRRRRATATCAAASKPPASSRSTTSGPGAGTASCRSDPTFFQDYGLTTYQRGTNLARDWR